MYQNQTYYFLIVISIYLSISIISTKSKIAAVCFFVLSLSGLTNIFHPEIFSPWMNPQNRETISYVSSYTFAYMVLSWLFVFLLTKKEINQLIEAFSWICIANSLFIIWETLFYQR